MPPAQTTLAQRLGAELFAAVNTEQFEAALRLIEAGADVNYVGQPDAPLGGGTPLHWAAFCGHLELVTRLLDRGAKVNARDNLGRMPLFPAAANGHVAVVRLLLKRGADVNAMNYRGWTLIPPDRRHPEVVRLLAKHGYPTRRGHGGFLRRLVGRLLGRLFGGGRR